MQRLDYTIWLYNTIKKKIEYTALVNEINMNNRIAAMQINFDWEQKQKEIEILHIKNNELEKVNSELENHREHLKMINKILRLDICDDLHNIETNLDNYSRDKNPDQLNKIKRTLKKSTNLIYQIRDLETFLDTHANLLAFKIEDMINDVIKNIDFADYKYSEPIKILAANDIKSMLIILIENMIKVRKANKIVISTSKIKGNCKILIIDDGLDIPEDTVEIILSSNNNKQRSKEEYSDLFRVKKMVEASGGFIFFEKNLLQGYTFTIVLRSID